MKLPRIEDLDGVFTYAESPDKRSTNLLFTSLRRKEHLFQKDVIKRITESPLYREIMGENSVVYPYETQPYPTLVATTEFTEHVASRMECAKSGEGAVVCRSGQPPELYDLHDLYYACKLPQKLILGCGECIKTSGSAVGCPIRQAAQNAVMDDYNGMLPEDLIGKLKSRSSRIADFVFVSPILTAHKDFPKTLRSIEEHDFSFVSKNAEKRESIIASRVQLNDMKKQVCVNCLAQKECHDTYDYSHGRWKIRRCDGPYPKTEEEATAYIMEKYPPPLSFEQMSVLLYNSGLLHKRYEGRICYFTFGSERGQHYYSKDGGDMLMLVVPRRHKYDPYVCKSYAEAIDIIKDRNGCVHDPPKIMTPKTYALLRESITHRRTPTNNNGWHSTSYERLFVEGNYAGGVQTWYTFNNRNQEVLPWDFVANTLARFHSHFGYINLLEHSPYELKPRRG